MRPVSHLFSVYGAQGCSHVRIISGNFSQSSLAWQLSMKAKKSKLGTEIKWLWIQMVKNYMATPKQ